MTDSRSYKHHRQTITKLYHSGLLSSEAEANPDIPSLTGTGNAAHWKGKTPAEETENSALLKPV